MSWKKIESFCLDIKEKFIYAATIGGEILKIDPVTFKIDKRFQSHGGTISIITSHNSLPYIATRSGGWRVILWKQESEGELKKLFEIDVLSISSTNNPYRKEPLEYGDQALAFHSTKPILATRTGEDELVEIEFNDCHYQVISYGYAHETFPIMTIRYVVNSDQILCGTVRGYAFLFEKGQIIRNWKLADEDIHWFEYYQNETYLVANDARHVIRLNILDKSLPFSGDKFARDDFEHITHDSITGQTFASSFDSKIYQIDPSTCSLIKVVWKAPYKCRWIHLLKCIPNTLVVQCRNGGLYKIDTENLAEITVIKETPNAIWSAARISLGKILAAGEGNQILEFSPDYIDNIHYRITKFKKQPFNLNVDFASNAFAKRLVFDKLNECVIIGRSDGVILFQRGEETLYTIALESSVRDLAIDKNSVFLYVACEDGKLLKLSLATRSIVAIWHSAFPLWALSLNEDRKVIAVSERMGSLVILDIHMLDPIHYEVNHRFSKRMKWLNEDTLLYSSEECIQKFDLNKLTSLSYVQNTGNTVEDFDWDNKKQYLVIINYNRKVILCNLYTGKVLDSVHDQFDISYGILWLDRYENIPSYPYEFITFGRAGMFCSYQVYENSILRHGYLD